ncbi:MAG TPA: GNAT family N-acetyltransferase [Gemmatimonadales bacterium]
MSASAGPALRLADPADAAALARLRFAFRADLESPAEAEADFLARCTPWMARRLEPGGSWRCWIAGGVEPVGAVWLQLIEKLPNPVAEPEWHGYVSSLFVCPDARGAGLGSRLLGAALAECDRRGCDAVVLWPTPRSRSLYLRHDFAVRDDLLERRGRRTTP